MTGGEEVRSRGDGRRGGEGREGGENSATDEGGKGKSRERCRLLITKMRSKEADHI